MVSRNSLFALDRLANLAIGLCGFRCHLQQIALTRLALFGRGHRKLVLGSGLQRQPDPAPLQSAGPNEVSFLDNQRYASALDQTLAGAVIVHPDMAARVPTGTVAIQTTEPYAAWARVAALFYPVPSVSPGIHPSAIVAEGALVDPSAEVGPLSCD